MTDNPACSNESSSPSSQSEKKTALVYKSDELLKGNREVWIEHASGLYRLRVTSAGKLYLTK